MKNTEVGLWDLPENKVYVKIKEPIRNILFNHTTKLTGNKANLDKLLGLDSSHRKKYETGMYFCPLRIIKKILDVYPESKRRELVCSIEKGIEEIRKGYGGKSKSIKNPKLPIKFSTTLSRIVGHIIGDGGVERTCYRVSYTNKSRILIDQFKRDIPRIFGKVEVYEYENDGVFEISFPGIVGIILTSFFGPMVRELKHIPQQLLNSSKKHKSIFLRALFDDEASVSTQKHNIEFVLTVKDIVMRTKDMLKEFGIRPTKIAERKGPVNWQPRYRFCITSRYDLECFSEKIGFDHPKKKRRLETLIQNYKKYLYKRGEIRELMYKIVKENGRISTKQLAVLLKREPSGRFYRHLCKLREERKIFVNKGYVTLNEEKN